MNTKTNHPTIAKPHHALRGQLIQMLQLVHRSEGKNPRYHLAGWWYDQLEFCRTRPGAAPNAGNFKDAGSLGTALSILYKSGMVVRKRIASSPGTRAPFTYMASPKLLQMSVDDALRDVNAHDPRVQEKAKQQNGAVDVALTLHVQLRSAGGVKHSFDMTLADACALRDQLTLALPSRA